MYLHIAKILMVEEQDLQGEKTGKCGDTVWIDSAAPEAGFQRRRIYDVDE